MGHTAGVSSLSTGEKTLVSAATDHTCRVWDFRAPSVAMLTLQGHSKPLYGACAAGNMIFTGGMLCCVITSNVHRC